MAIYLERLMNKIKTPQDWPNLNRYAEENEKLTFEDNRIVFMGDSITEGWLRLYPDFFCGKPYVNRGIGGQTTPQMLLRFRADVLKLKPKMVVILGGINDIAGNTGPSTLEMILDNIISMTELARANAIEVILCSVLPANGFYWNPSANPKEKIRALNEMIKVYARQQSIPYVDFHAAMRNSENELPKELGPDGVHPNLEGYRVMSDVIAKTLK